MFVLRVGCFDKACDAMPSQLFEALEGFRIQWVRAQGLGFRVEVVVRGLGGLVA